MFDQSINQSIKSIWCGLPRPLKYAYSFSSSSVRVTKEHNDEAKHLLKLMGIPYFEAPSEAEAQCAALVKEGKVFATATEDMDALTFASPVLLRHMTFSEAKKMPIQVRGEVQSRTI